MKTTVISIFLLAGTLLSCNSSTSKKDEISLPKHVILVGFDGLSASSIHKGADMPMLRQLMAEGSSTLECRSILPSSSACNWASMALSINKHQIDHSVIRCKLITVLCFI